MTGDIGLRLFMAEHNLHGLTAPQLASAHQALAEAVGREALRGNRIRYVQRIFAPQDGRCLCLFEADGPQVVQAVNDIAQFPLTHVTAVTSTVPPDPRPPVIQQ